jgi:hypothetical protein
MAERWPIGPLTVTVLGSRWKPGPAWDGFCWERAVLRGGSIWGGDDYHLAVPWRHADDSRVPWDDCGVYRLRLKRGWKRFVQVDDVWMVERCA